MKMALITAFALIIAMTSLLGACDTDNQQTMNVQNGKGAQSQSGRGNKQSMNVSGGSATQNQSGWGNKQSMNIGNVNGKDASDKGDEEEVVEVKEGETVSISQNQSGVGKSQSTTVIVKKK